MFVLLRDFLLFAWLDSGPFYLLFKKMKSQFVHCLFLKCLKYSKIKHFDILDSYTYFFNGITGCKVFPFISLDWPFWLCKSLITFFFKFEANICIPLNTDVMLS